MNLILYVGKQHRKAVHADPRDTVPILVFQQPSGNQLQKLVACPTTAFPVRMASAVTRSELALIWNGFSSLR